MKRRKQQRAWSEPWTREQILALGRIQRAFRKAVLRRMDHHIAIGRLRPPEERG